MEKKTAIILSISSDIGYEIAKDFLNSNIKVFGTYRTKSKKIKSLIKLGAKVYKLNLLDSSNIDKISNNFFFMAKKWDYFISSAGNLNPIDKILKSNSKKWENSIYINCLSQIRFLKNILKDNKRTRRVIFFAGGGTNNATSYYSAYTLSKIFLIKYTELLNFEEQKVIATILGPGWLKTKIHKQTMKSGKGNIKKTRKLLLNKKSEDFTQLLNCIKWILKKPKKVVGGRNFSLINDRWDTKKLESLLKSDSNIYKLRRFGN